MTLRHADHHHHLHRRKARRRISVVVFDERAIAQFLLSVARVQVLTRRASMGWEAAKEASCVDYLIAWYTSLLLNDPPPPGVATLNFGTEATINQDQLVAARKLATEFAKRVRLGSGSGLRFLEEQEHVRERALTSLQAFRNEANALNRRFQEDVGLTTAPWVVTKCVDTIIWKTIGAFTNVAYSFFFDLGYDVAVDIAQEWQQAELAEVALSASKEAASDVVEELDKKGAESMSKTLDGMLLQVSGENLTVMIKNYESSLIGNATHWRLPHSVQLVRRMHIASAFGKAVSHGLKIVWLGKDIYKAVAEAHETLKQLDFYDTVRRRW